MSSTPSDADGEDDDVLDMRVIVKTPTALEKKLRGFHRRNCMVLADFDATLTYERFPGGGAKRANCHTAVMQSPLMSSEFKEEMNKLFVGTAHKDSLSPAEKEALMMKSFRDSNDLFITHGFRRDYLAPMVAESTMALRRDAAKLAATAASAGIPLLVFSAGIRELIQEALSQGGISVGENDALLANGMVFDEDGALVRWEEPVVHVDNKSLTLFPEFLERLTARDTQRPEKALLIGDKLGDLTMAHGLPLDSAVDVLTIGLLNDADATEEVVKTYSDAFDVVLQGDGPLDFVVELLERICRAPVPGVARQEAAAEGKSSTPDGSSALPLGPAPSYKEVPYY
eukprot:gnl/TRDRNA2_/TRDRNA2_143932_c0_seq1.p1 gnl/TRDRNA2_/TRDRNA2_143932_c0~~gnl/TRDRNA2_/TRDRNA2_143932_c0_seq1.p1  ORF type:complete len:342 (-),score=82.17 gnl/TRDRNA2_/TRDRNA2_143932_c0_seq1:17-1042(-)